MNVKSKNFFQTMTCAEYRQAVGLDVPRAPVEKVSHNKYGAQKTEVDGFIFDSKKESRDWESLCVMEAAGIISNLRRQVAFELQGKYITRDGRKIRPITYVADFVYERDGNTYVADSKSPATRTAVYKIKKKLFEKIYSDYIFVEI